MLVWFVFRDEPGQPWQSGCSIPRPREAGARRFAAPPCRTRATCGGGRSDELVHDFRVPALELRSHLEAGDILGVHYSLVVCRKSVAAA